MKKIIYAFFVIIILLFIDTKALGLGDVDDNGKIGSSDYVLIRKFILKMSTLSDSQQKAADLSQDGVINSKLQSS